MGRVTGETRDFTDSHYEVFERARPGPEADLVQAVLSWLQTLPAKPSCGAWIGRGLSIGAGDPDILLVAFRPALLACPAEWGDAHARVLAYLQTIRWAGTATVSTRLATKVETTERLLADLHKGRAITKRGSAFGLADDWRDILPDSLAIEAKVNHWQRATRQASRNRLFAHRSYVALPPGQAQIAIDSGRMRTKRLGVLSVDGPAVQTQVKSRKLPPVAWYYYYYLALSVARSCRGRA